ncbi:MAG: rhomboid family intramembrane serine protease [Bacteroidota bacterium]
MHLISTFTMRMNEDIEVKQSKPFPLLTMVIVLLCIGVYATVKIKFGDGQVPNDFYPYLGAPFTSDIYLGQFWGIITNNFLHLYWFHLLINVVLVFSFSSFIERRISFFRLFFLGLSVAAFSSCAQLFLTNDPGIGLDGVNYGLFGFILVRRFFDARFKKFPIKRVSMLMIVLMTTCYYLTIIYHWKFEFVAMFSGFMIGVVVSFLYVKKMFSTMFMLLIGATIFCVINFVNAPWSSEWNFAQGIKYHESGDIEKAIDFYDKSLEINPNNKLAQENLRRIKIDKLCERAYEAHAKEDYVEARKLYLEVLKIDKDNVWANENFKKLP